MADPRGTRRPLTRAADSVVVWLVVQVLGVYKSRGMTRYGRRKQHERREVSHSIPAAPRHHLAYPK
jgi:hypothetical protein